MPYNRAMTNLDIILPFAFPPAEHTKDLLAALQAPGLASLLTKASLKLDHDSAPFNPGLPHECWLAENDDNSPPIARLLMQQLNLTPQPGHWLILQPANLHIARDHLVLTDFRDLLLTERESRHLFNSAQSIFADSGMTLEYGSPDMWFLHADAWQTLRTCTPDVVCGHNIDVWMPRGAGEREWRKIQNELQMLWHTDALNEEREAQGKPRINTAWLWGGASADFSTSPNLQLFAQSLHPKHVQVSFAALNDETPHQRVLLNQLLHAALHADWASWLSAFAELDATWFIPVAQSLREGRIKKIALILSHNDRLQHWQITSLAMRKFWLKDSLKRLAA